MAELSPPGAVIEIVTAARRVWRWPSMMGSARLAIVVSLASVSSLHAQSASPVRQPLPPRAIYTPKPVYRAEWAKEGLTGKGIVLVTIDKQTGKVTGAQMLQSTGNRQLDGSALEAYSQWRFDPRTVTVSQLKIPIEFANRPKPPTASRTPLKPAILYPLLILFGFAVAVMAMRARRKG
ncbi:MAG TPA: energy transducer TonB [Pyrinomonadaceae bacterium]|jgi:TonB family protein|nr:energy transducer TonB [Pyrinomonadaceae bacterium]